MHDVLVVGGGPAGAAIATMAAGAGASVVLLERETFPRDKVCGEFLSAEGCLVLRELGVLDSLLGKGAEWIDACRLTDGAGRTVDTALPDPGLGHAALGVSRELLDTTLLDRAGKAGVKIRARCEAVSPILKRDQVIGVRARAVGDTGAEEAIEARVVVAADGRRSAILRALDPGSGDPSRTTSRSWFGHKVHLAGAHSPPRGRVELHVFDGGYAGIAPIEADRVNLCLLARVAALRACGGSLERLLEERSAANPAARKALLGASPCGEWKSVGPLRFGVRRPVLGGAFLIGDAAGTVDPFSGEGMSNALLGARIALPYVLEAAEHGRLSAELERAYRKAWTREFRSVTRRVRGLATVFAHPGVASLAVRLFSGRAKPLLGAIVASTRTVAPRSRRRGLSLRSSGRPG